MKILTLILALVSIPVTTHSTDIYQFIIWNQYIDQNNKLYNNKDEFQSFLSKNGLKQIRVIYRNRFLTKGKPDPEKIEKIADLSKQDPLIPISFDIEIGNKFKPQTILPTVNKVLDLYHQYGGAAPVGVYGILPQDIASEKLNKNTEIEYTQLNKQYEGIATKVDFISPVIYNNSFNNFYEWKKRTEYHLSEAKKYATKYNLKIIPYFSSSYLDKNFSKNRIIKPLSEQEMKQRLAYIKSKDVDGIIIWDTSIGILENGAKPIFDANQGFGKAIIEFIKE